MAKPPKGILTREEIRELKGALESAALDEGTRRRLLRMVDTVDAAYEELGQADTTVGRLRAIVRAVRGPKAEAPEDDQ